MKVKSAGKKGKKQEVKSNIFRVCDVNLNRAREGIRVIEDTARLVWDNKQLYRQLRSLRHRLDTATRAMGKVLVASRNAAEDVGRRVQGEAFGSVGTIVQANFRRAEEAVRVLEEYARFFDISLTGQFQDVRFALYTIEKKIYKKYLN